MYHFELSVLPAKYNDTFQARSKATIFITLNYCVINAYRKYTPIESMMKMILRFWKSHFLNNISISKQLVTILS